MVFVKKETEEEVFNIATTLGLRPVKGEVGIEIELEGNKFPKNNPPKGWTYYNDNSLRGQDNAEYLLTTPVSFKEVPKYLSELWAALKAYGTVISPSNRTSVHVHLNVTEFHLNRLAALIALYFSFEEILTEWCGEHRVGNLFCLRAKDAPAIVSSFAEFISQNMERPFHDGFHYSGLSATAIRKHGSLEIRTLRGVDDPQTVQEWVAILQRLYEASAGFSDPRKICEDFSFKGPMAFLEEVFGDKAQLLRQGLDDDFIRQSLYEGVRMYAQDICYSKDWDTFKPINVRRDPFGRDPRKLKKRAQAEGVLGNIEWQATPGQTFAQLVQAGQQIYTANPFHTDTTPAPAIPNWEPTEDMDID